MSEANPCKRICLWSGPRNVSTALMYSFAQRADTRCVDEPLYGHYLEVSGARHPGGDEVVRALDTDGERVVREVVLGPSERPVLFLKMMAHHLIALDWGFLDQTVNVILTRDPREVLASLVRQVPQPRLADTGYEVQLRLSERFPDAPVVDARELLTDPPGVLAELCRRLSLDFDPGMLSWPPGAKSCDGVWAPHWYHNVHRSTGFQPYRPKTRPLDPALEPLLAECRPLYRTLYARAIRATRGTSMTDSPPLRELLPDPRNADIKVHVGGRLVPRAEARVSVFDSVVQGGDAVWEGLRVYDGRIFMLDAHLERLLDSAKALAFAAVPDRDAVKAAIFETLEANGMRDAAHIRLTLTRGEKTTSGMSPEFNRFGPTLIVLAEWKPPVYDNSAGVRLITSAIRRNTPSCLDSKIHHNNLLNNILAKIQANLAGVDDALMLDLNGFLSETNATNVFIVRDGVLLTPHADACLPGITRGVVIDLAGEAGIACRQTNLSLAQAYTAAEMFTTGTMGELSPVIELDGRVIGDGRPGPVTRGLQRAYRQRTASLGEPLPF